MIKHILTLVWNKKKSNILLLLEIFFAFMILYAVFSMFFSEIRKYKTPLGFETDQTWICQLTYEDMDSTALAEMKLGLINELRSKKEIESISYMGWIYPFCGSTWSTNNDNAGFFFSSKLIYCDEDYLKTAGLNLIEGRWFTSDDANHQHGPIVISSRIKNDFFKNRPYKDSVYSLVEEENQIIGVIDHYKYSGEFVEDELITFIYSPPTSEDTPTLVMKWKAGTSPKFEKEVFNIVASYLKKTDFVIINLEEARKRTSRQTWIPLIALLSICVFLILNVALGLFGILWYNISKRRAEIGLRRTLGASRSNISQQLILEILLVTLSGILIACFFALQVPLLKLFEIENINYYYAILAASLLIIFVVLICTFYPSRQAALIQPAIALHED